MPQRRTNKLAGELAALELERVALFAPRNCTGNSGDIGDTILQSSLVRTLLDRSIFPKLTKLQWYGTKWVVDQLFLDLASHVEVLDWKGDPEGLPAESKLKGDGVQALLVCTRNPEVLAVLKRSPAPCHTPAEPLDANSTEHLSRQLHGCLLSLGVHATDLPSPRIVVHENEIHRVRRQMTQHGLEKLATESVPGVQPFEPECDRVFLVNPAVGEREDERTWPRDSWQTLVRRLAGVGVVLVSYNPKDHLEQRSAEHVVAGPPAFKSRFAIPLSLPELASYAAVCTVSLARDSGPMHVVAATVGPRGRPRVLGLVSVMNPATWRPLSERFEAMGRWPLPLTESVAPQDAAVRAAQLSQRGGS